MTFKPAIWTPIAAILSVLNLVAVGFAAGQPEPWHAGGHAALALGFGLWAQRLRQRSQGSELQGSELQGSAEIFEAIDGLEAEVSKMRRELGEVQERLDFTERMLAQVSEARRLDPMR